MEYITVRAFVEQILDALPKPWGADIIDRVFQAIEASPETMNTYEQMVLAHGRYPVENSIAFSVIAKTGLKRLESTQPAKSKLIENYTELG